jgi:AcrR family transcriptional regulator
MRLLSERIGSGTATLYRHFAGRDELMVHVVDLILGEVGPEGDGDVAAATTWQDAIARGAGALYEVLQRHPNALPLLTSQVPVGPNALARRERMLAVLIACGFPLELAARSYTAVAHYVVGFAVQQHAPAARQNEDPTALRDFYAALDADSYPATVAAANELTSVPPREEFRFGLQLVLEGVAHARTATAAAPHARS